MIIFIQFLIKILLTYHPLTFNLQDHSATLNITEADVYNTLVSLDTSKAMGPDGIPPIVLSKCALALYKPLHYLFNLPLQFSYLPCEWKGH